MFSGLIGITHMNLMRRFPLGCSLAVLMVWAIPLRAAPTSQPSGPALPPHVVRVADIRYGDGPGKSNLLDLYLPDKADHARPLIVWIHGGGWAAGDKTGCPAIPAVSHGFVVASLNYRLSGQATYPAQIQDCKGAIRFLRAHADQYHIDPNKIGVWGASAGGHLVALLGTSGGSTELEGTIGGNLDQSSRVQAVCDWFGPTDLTKFADQAQAAGIMQITPGPTLIMKLFGGSLQDKKDLVKEANPITYIPKQQQLPPFLIMHGDKDKLVPVAQSQLLYDALKTAGASVDLQVIPGAGHGNGFNTPRIASIVLTFFKSNLK
jgi:acetyl esterase/lipase